MEIIMTTFESSVTMFTVTAIVFILVIGIVTVVNKLKDIISWQKSIWNELRSIHVNVADTAEYTHNHIAPDMKDLRDIEKTNQELLMPVIKWQRRLVDADTPTALDGLNNVQKDDANKSNNNGYDPTLIVKGSETMHEKDEIDEMFTDMVLKGKQNNTFNKSEPLEPIFKEDDIITDGKTCLIIWDVDKKNQEYQVHEINDGTTWYLPFSSQTTWKIEE